MSFTVRAATIGDLWALQPVMRPADVAAYGVQLARSQTFALEGAGGLFAAGGIYLEADLRERVCWMLSVEKPPARDLLTGVRLICDHAGPGYPLAAYIDMRVRRNLRFAEALGFVSSARIGPPTLPASVVRVERRT